MIDLPPLTLYVHMPWCVKKCPYCDFNSHDLRDAMPPCTDYIDTLLADLDADLADFGATVGEREIISVFFGGGTPSLFAPEDLARFLDKARQCLRFTADTEITMETNPGAIEHGRFEDYRAIGINRLSFGVQSFDDAMLHRLGRIHSAAEAEHAIELARTAGYNNINIDLMYALPEQKPNAALLDIERALSLQPTHISHYQLTIEPNTAFAAQPPSLADDDSAWDMQEICQARLADAGFAQYEVSAYACDGYRCRHNLNYWGFGDYLGIGAGAHGKLSIDGRIHRRWKQRLPKTYMGAGGRNTRLGGDYLVADTELAFEYMLNALRLIDGTPLDAFTARTGLSLERIHAPRNEAMQRQWLLASERTLQATPLGQRFLNDVTTLFM